MYTSADRDRIHQALDNILSTIEAEKRHVKNPVEIDLEVRLYYGRYGTTCATMGYSFSRLIYAIGRLPTPFGKYLWDEGDPK
jgi:hypothetical protein